MPNPCVSQLVGYTRIRGFGERDSGGGGDRRCTIPRVLSTACSKQRSPRIVYVRYAE